MTETNEQLVENLIVAATKAGKRMGKLGKDTLDEPEYISEMALAKQDVLERMTPPLAKTKGPTQEAPAIDGGENRVINGQWTASDGGGAMFLQEPIADGDDGPG